jgi:quinolinate synthase
MTVLETHNDPALHAAIRELAETRNAVILAHNYERPEVQDVAHYVGDSLGLSREAARTDAEVIVFCGVHFMAETAKILSPSKTVLLPDLAAGCSLASTIDAEQLRAWKAEHPGAVVVAYVNTTADVKAESDYCCTSGNAVEVVNAIDPTARSCSCPTCSSAPRAAHHRAREHPRVDGRVPRARRHRPRAHQPAARGAPGREFLIHPECGCATPVVEAVSAGAIDARDVHILSTEGMIKRPPRARPTSSSSPPSSASSTGCGARTRARRSSRRTTARSAPT